MSRSLDVEKIGTEIVTLGKGLWVTASGTDRPSPAIVRQTADMLELKAKHLREMAAQKGGDHA